MMPTGFPSANAFVGGPNFNPMGPGGNPMANQMGGCGCGNPMGQMGQLNMMMQQLQMMEMMVDLMSMMMGGGNFMGDMMGMPGMGNGFPQMGGFPGGGGGFPQMGGFPGGNYGGPGGNFGGNYGGGPGGVGGPAPISGTAGQGSQAAVDLGRRFLGRDSWTIKGQLPNFTAAGGRTNNCADFVSSLLQSTGGLQGHFVNVRGLEAALKKQGYRQVPAHLAKPGDVWINHSRGHTEMVTAPGGTRTIGSNNIRQGHQQISERNKDPRSGVYYTRG